MKDLNRQLILTDQQFKDYNPELQIARFFKKRKCFLYELGFAQYVRNALIIRFPHTNGIEKVKPPYCSIELALCSLQREKGLLSITIATAKILKQIPKRYKVVWKSGQVDEIKSNQLDEKLDWSFGYGCLDKKNIHDSEYPLRQAEYRGFEKQCKFACRRYAELFASWQHGKKLSIQPLDREEYGIACNIIPDRASRWALLEYNPRFEGEMLTGQLYKQWFK